MRLRLLNSSRPRAALLPALILVGSLGLFVFDAPRAGAAQPCGTHRVGPQLLKSRVAAVAAPCGEAVEVVSDLYEKIDAGVRPDRHYRWHVDSYACFTGLASSEVWCHHRRSWIFASTRPEDHPARWPIPNESKRRPYWQHCSPPPSIISNDMLVHRVGCRKARVLITRVLVKSQTAQSAHVHALGFTCGLRPYAERAISCRKGGRRVLSPLAG
jgi:hypothetical protein